MSEERCGPDEPQTITRKTPEAAAQLAGVVLVILDGIRAAARPVSARPQALSLSAAPTPVDTPEGEFAK